MNHGPMLFLVAFLALAGSWFGMVLVPQTQLGQLQPTNTVGSAGSAYPIGPAGLAQQGLQVYRAEGCAYCHSQQVRQRGADFDVVLNDIGTNEPALIETLTRIKSGFSSEQAREFLAGLPKAVARMSVRHEAETEVRTLRAAGAKADLWIMPYGPDIARGFGKRRTVAEDFLMYSTVMPGSIRIGPDLANVGARNPDANWHLRHLYSPGMEVKGSPMPAYRYLFEKRKIIHTASRDALWLPPEAKVPAGYEIVPRSEAKALVAYLASLRVEAPLFDAPLTVPAPPAAPGSETNAPAGGTNAPAGDTNAPTASTNTSTGTPSATNAPKATNTPAK